MKQERDELRLKTKSLDKVEKELKSMRKERDELKTKLKKTES